jgi:hypothetical protein
MTYVMECEHFSLVGNKLIPDLGEPSNYAERLSSGGE